MRRHILRADGREQDIVRPLSRVECILMLDADDMQQVTLAPALPDWLLLFDGHGHRKGLMPNARASLLVLRSIYGDALMLPAADFIGGTP